MPSRARTAFARLAVVPFESAIGLLAVVSAITGLLHFGGVAQDAISLALPKWMVVLTFWLYGISGLVMAGGAAGGRGDVESFGLVMLAVSIMVRSVALITVIGWRDTIAVSLMFNVILVGACAARLTVILRGDQVVRTQSVLGED